MWLNPQDTADLVTFTEESLNGKLHFLCSAVENLFSPAKNLCFPVYIYSNQSRIFFRQQIIFIFRSRFILTIWEHIYTNWEFIFTRKINSYCKGPDSTPGGRILAINFFSFFLSYLFIYLFWSWGEGGWWGWDLVKDGVNLLCCWKIAYRRWFIGMSFNFLLSLNSKVWRELETKGDNEKFRKVILFLL